MPRFALVLMSMLLALTLGCSPQPPAKPATPAASKAPAQVATPAAPSIGDANPLDGAATFATTLWGGAATWYILCRDDFVQTFLARQAEMRFDDE